MIFRSGSWIFLGMVIVVLSTGCANLGRKMEQPKVQLHSVSLKKVENAAATLMVGVEVENPNTFALRVKSLRYEAELGGRHLAAGAISDPLEVPSKGKAVVEIPVAVKYTDLLSSVIDFLGRINQEDKKTRYRVKGTVGVGIFEIPFDEQGELKIE